MALREAIAVATLSLLKTKAQNFLKDQRGAVGFEYALIIGGVSAVILIAVGSRGAIPFWQCDGQSMHTHEKHI